ncbi:hypothetical protein [Nocardia spumae]|uniref:hypothetical protein n=1 Tax=Nocardia spumae TaxID=2887190 RepID=UPI002101E44A|nr:hypothetical protein [Nocardia spumae]
MSGTLTQRNWEDEQQQKHSIYELDAEEVAASLRFAQVSVKRITRSQQAPAA